MWEFIKNLFRQDLKLPPLNLIIEEPKETDIHFENIEPILGGDVLFAGDASFDWRPFLPEHEIQAHGDCVSFSRNNCAEIKANSLGAVDPDGDEFNFADLWLAVKSGTSKTGNGMNRVAETARKVGVPLEKYCPYTRIWNERTAHIVNTPKDVKRYKLGGHAWVGAFGPVGNDKNYALKKALAKSPLQLGIGLGDTWRRGGVIQPPSSIKGYHAITLVYMTADNQKHCYDHYNRKMVILSADYPIAYAKTFLDLPDNWRGVGVGDAKLLLRMIGKLIIRHEVDKGAHGELYRVSETKLKKVRFSISDKELMNAVHDTARRKKMFTGITEADFKRISEQVFSVGGSIEEPDKEIGLEDILLNNKTI